MPLAPALLLQHISPTNKILVAVSGGLDSVVLLHALLKAGIRVGVAHVNFGLRGSESDQDEAFVQELARQYGVPFFSTRFQTKIFAEEHGISTQMAARELRYGWFEQVRLQQNFDLVATAHHLNDSLETALLNLVRGTGPAGLSGIKPVSGNLVRPLQPFARTEIEAYAHKNNLTWREDSSNATDAYKRNFLRHQVIPLLKKLNPNLLHTFQETSQRLTEAQELVQKVAQQTGIEKGNGNIWRIRKGNLPEVARALVLHELLRPFGFTYRQAAQITTSLNGLSGKRFLSASHEIIIDRDELLISAKVTPANPSEIAVSPGQAIAEIGSKVFRFQEISATNFQLAADPFIAALDLEKLEFPLILRKWQTGDRFRPLGMKGQKKVSDLLIDRKVPLPEKEQVLVLESGEEIAWVVGFQISDNVKLTPASRRVLVVSVSEKQNP